MTAIFTLFEGAIYSTLRGNASLVAAVDTSGGLSGVYDTIAPAGAKFPMVIFQNVAGGDTNDSPRRNIDGVWRIEARAKDRATAAAIAGYIDDALHNQELTIPGWSNWRAENERLLSLVDLIDGVEYFRKGGFFRISADKNNS